MRLWFGKIVSGGALICACALSVAAAPAPDLVLAEDADGVKVTVAMVQEELSFRAPEEQAKARHDPVAVEEVVRTLFRREKLLREAERQQVESDPKVQYRLAMARKDVLINALREKAAEKPIPDLEARAQEYYRLHPEEFTTKERIKASHILLKAASDGERQHRKEEMEKIIAEVKGGADFAELAKKYSEDSSNEKGGDLGWFSQGQMVRPFEEAAFALKEPGALSGIVESKFGLHLIRLEAREAAHLTPYEEIKGPLLEKLTKKFGKEMVFTWLKEVTTPNGLARGAEIGRSRSRSNPAFGAADRAAAGVTGAG